MAKPTSAEYKGLKLVLESAVDKIEHNERSTEKYNELNEFDAKCIAELKAETAFIKLGINWIRRNW